MGLVLCMAFSSFIVGILWSEFQKRVSSTSALFDALALIIYLVNHYIYIYIYINPIMIYNFSLFLLTSRTPTVTWWGAVIWFT